MDGSLILPYSKENLCISTTPCDVSFRPSMILARSGGTRADGRCPPRHGVAIGRPRTGGAPGLKRRKFLQDLELAGAGLACSRLWPAWLELSPVPGMQQGVRRDIDGSA